MDDNDDDIIEGTPPELLVVSMGSNSQPLETVQADIEFVGFTTPQPSTSKPAASELDEPYVIDADIEVELPDPDDNGSEIDADNDLGLWRSRVAEFEIDDPTDLEVVLDIDHEADAALRAMANPEEGDLLTFDWRSEIDNFTGVREIFTGPSGPTFDVSGQTPLDLFKKIWDDNIINHIVHQTNLYAHQEQIKVSSKKDSRMSRWQDTTVEEFWRFLSIIMIQSLFVNNVEREYWYPRMQTLKLGATAKIMSFNRFVLLKRCLHFVDNSSLPRYPSKIDKIMPVIKHLNNKFSMLYLPEQNVAIDESLLLWKGRLSFSQFIATKRARVGIKSYELCESRTGYLWRMEIYSRGHVHEPQVTPQQAVEDIDLRWEPEGATSQIVYKLMRPLFGKGHTVIMDNFYNAPLLSRLLKKKHGTDSMGTLRLNREFVPETLKNKHKNNMKAGEVCFSTTSDLCLVDVVSMISTFHKPEVGGKEKYGYYKYKPKVVLDYNLSMGGVDHKDQLLHAFPIERVRNITWYKKLFRRLVNVSIHNALVIYNHDRTRQAKLGNRDFRMQLLEEMLQMYSPHALTCNTHTQINPPTELLQMHLRAKNEKSKQCKLCTKNKVRRSTVWRCGSCQVSLCIEGCYTEYHSKYV